VIAVVILPGNRPAETRRHRIDEDEVADVDEPVLVVDEFVGRRRSEALLVHGHAAGTEDAEMQPHRGGPGPAVERERDRPRRRRRLVKRPLAILRVEPLVGDEEDLRPLGPVLVGERDRPRAGPVRNRRAVDLDLVGRDDLVLGVGEMQRADRSRVGRHLAIIGLAAPARRRGHDRRSDDQGHEGRTEQARETTEVEGGSQGHAGIIRP